MRAVKNLSTLAQRAAQAGAAAKGFGMASPVRFASAMFPAVAEKFLPPHFLIFPRFSEAFFK